ncbi:hypothetical protein OEZ86_006278 [Tetradesmus obliquus]|nr:hypothetical protein OEZ86_006278 [Tetradesmus obliquus]
MASQTCSPAVLLLALSAVMILSCSSGGADAADAKLGAFIGCANMTKPEWIRRTADYTNFRQFTPQTIQGCRKHCTDQGYPLALVSRDWRCRCTLNLPEYYYMWPDYVLNKEECIPMPSKPNVETAAVYYLHANANTAGCRLSYPEFHPVNRTQWSSDYKAANIEFRNNTRGGSLYIKQTDSASGARLRSTDGDHLHGVWQVRALPTARTNSVTVFKIRWSTA